MHNHDVPQSTGVTGTIGLCCADGHISNNTYICDSSPKFSGCYRLEEFPYTYQFYLKVKPNLFHRIMMRLALGFRWIDNVQ